MKSEENLLWIDLEMTGLNFKKDKIIEVACIVTDKDLNILAMGPDLPIKVSNLRLKRMDDWNKTHHNDSGLIKRIQEGGVPIKKAEQLILDFVKEYCIEGKTIMAGIGIFRDRQFIDNELPALSKYLHYRMLDVSPLFQLQSRWYPDIQWKAEQSAHRAMADVIQSIEILKFFRKNIFK